MKKVIAFALAAVMVCTMAFAVSIGGPGSATNPDAEYIVVNPGETVYFTLSELYNGNYAKNDSGEFDKSKNNVEVTFGTGANLVASQGWVKNGSEYVYAITLVKDNTATADGKTADITITKVVAKAFGKDSVTVYEKASTGNDIAAVAPVEGSEEGQQLAFDFGYEAGKTINFTAGANNTAVVTFNAENLSATPKFFKTMAADSVTDASGNMLFTASAAFQAATDAGKMVVNATVKSNNSYLMWTGATALNAESNGYFKNSDAFKVYTDNLTKNNADVKAYYVGGTYGILPVSAKVYDVSGTWYAYSVNADGTVAALNATTADGVMSINANTLGAMIVTNKPLTATSTGNGTGSGNGNGSTSNPNTGANDVVGVAVVLAVVTAASAAAISLKKK